MQDWECWLMQAEDDAEVAKILAGQGKWASATYYALQAIEAADKALRANGVTFRQLDVQIGDLGTTTISDLGPEAPQRRHAVSSTQSKVVMPSLCQKIHSLGMGWLNQATRYPDVWIDKPGDAPAFLQGSLPSTITPPCQLITEHHYLHVSSIMASFLAKTRRLLGD